MKKLLFVLFLLPIVCFGQVSNISDSKTKQQKRDSIANADFNKKLDAYIGVEMLNPVQYTTPIFVDTAVVFTETGILDFNRKVGSSLITSGAFLLVGTTLHVINSSLKSPNSKDFPPDGKKYNSAYESFLSIQKTLNIMGLTSFGISSIFFITSGVLYAKQIQLRKNIKIISSPNMTTVQLNF